MQFTTCGFSSTEVADYESMNTHHLASWFSLLIYLSTSLTHGISFFLWVMSSWKLTRSCNVFKVLLAEKQTHIKSKLIKYTNAIKANGFSSETPTFQNQFLKVGFNWEIARTQVLAALQSYGCFNVIYDGVRPEVLFQSIMPKIFALPLEVKQLIKESKYSYLAHELLTNVAYESINVLHPTQRVSKY